MRCSAFFSEKNRKGGALGGGVRDESFKALFSFTPIITTDAEFMHARSSHCQRSIATLFRRIILHISVTMFSVRSRANLSEGFVQVFRTPARFFF